MPSQRPSRARAISSTPRRPGVVIAHDYLTQRGGAERVVLALADAFPDAPIVTSVYNPETTFPEFADRVVRTSRLQRINRFRIDPRLALPLLPAAWSSLRVRPSDTVIASSAGFAHGLKTSGRKVVYCHNPARWLYQQEEYLLGQPRAIATLLKLGTPSLRRWDQTSAASADTYLANSTTTAARVSSHYGISARVVHPPSIVDPAGSQQPLPGIEPGFLLTVARRRGYKNTSIACEAVDSMPGERLVVVGGLPESASGAAWSDRLTGVTDISDAELRWLYANCDGLIAASFEDFGLTPVEAAAFGKPTIALGAGGYLDTVVDGRTGFLVDNHDVESFRRGIGRLRTHGLDPRHITEHATRFSTARFVQLIKRAVEDAHAASRCSGIRSSGEEKIAA